MRKTFQFSIGDAEAAKAVGRFFGSVVVVSILYWRCERAAGAAGVSLATECFNSLLEMHIIEDDDEFHEIENRL